MYFFVFCQAKTRNGESVPVATINRA